MSVAAALYSSKKIKCNCVDMHQTEFKFSAVVILQTLFPRLQQGIIYFPRVFWNADIFT